MAPSAQFLTGGRSPPRESWAKPSVGRRRRGPPPVGNAPTVTPVALVLVNGVESTAPIPASAALAARAPVLDHAAIREADAFGAGARGRRSRRFRSRCESSVGIGEGRVSGDSPLVAAGLTEKDLVTVLVDELREDLVLGVLLNDDAAGDTVDEAAEASLVLVGVEDGIHHTLAKAGVVHAQRLELCLTVGDLLANGRRTSS